MNFAPPVLPPQLAFPFIESREPESPTPWQRLGLSRTAYFTRRRLQRAVAAAFELGGRRRCAVPPASKTRPYSPSSAEANELAALAARVARLAPSHRDPEKFHLEKDAIRRELLALSRRRAPVT